MKFANIFIRYEKDWNYLGFLHVCGVGRLCRITHIWHAYTKHKFITPRNNNPTRAHHNIKQSKNNPYFRQENNIAYCNNKDQHRHTRHNITYRNHNTTYRKCCCTCHNRNTYRHRIRKLQNCVLYMYGSILPIKK